MKNGEKIHEFIWRNAWQLLVAVVVGAMAFATLSSRVSAVENGHQKIEDRLDKVDAALTELVKINERQINIQSDIAEIKTDIKAIKADLYLK